jgi:hypothetical protein
LHLRKAKLAIFTLRLGLQVARTRCIVISASGAIRETGSGNRAGEAAVPRAEQRSMRGTKVPKTYSSSKLPPGVLGGFFRVKSKLLMHVSEVACINQIHLLF